MEKKIRAGRIQLTKNADSSLDFRFRHTHRSVQGKNKDHGNKSTGSCNR